jgi:phosphoglycolate phosphatase-like HAD superfamily hydrolase
MLAILALFPHLSAANTLTIGDALIDIRAADAAKITFVAYNSSREEDWHKAPCRPVLELHNWGAESIATLKTELRKLPC